MNMAKKGQHKVNGRDIDLSEKKTAVLELVEKCPQSENIVNLGCPIRNVRKLNKENQNNYINGLSEGQLDHILNVHGICRKQTN